MKEKLMNLPHGPQKLINTLIHRLNHLFVMQVKCHKYWPDEKKSISCYKLRVTTDSENVFPVFVLSKIKITDTKVKLCKSNIYVKDQ